MTKSSVPCVFYFVLFSLRPFRLRFKARLVNSCLERAKCIHQHMSYRNILPRMEVRSYPPSWLRFLLGSSINLEHQPCDNNGCIVQAPRISSHWYLCSSLSLRYLRPTSHAWPRTPSRSTASQRRLHRFCTSRSLASASAILDSAISTSADSDKAFMGVIALP